MAETTKKRTTFKKGDLSFLSDDYNNLDSEQRAHFKRMAQEQGGFDAAGLAVLDEILNGYVKDVSSGSGFNSDGGRDTDKVVNMEMKTKKPGLFKKKVYTKQDIAAWGKYYFNKLVSNLKEYKEEDETKKDSDWDISKHGFAAYLTGQGYNAKGFFEGYDKHDPNNPDAERSFAQRHAELRKHLNGYKEWLSKKGFDFTKNDNDWDDDFVTSLEGLINNQNWGDSNELAARLRKLGAGDAYTTAFTSDRWDLTKTDEELTAARTKRKDEEAERKKKGYMDEFEDYSYGKRRESNPLYYTPFDYSVHNFDGKEANFRNWYADLNNQEQTKYGTYLGTDNQKWHNAWTSYINSLKGGNAYTDKNLGVLLQGTFESQGHQFVDLGDGNYLIKDSVTDDGQGTVYNPKSGYTDTIFLGDFASNNAAIKDIYKQLAYKYINGKYGTTYEDRPDVFKDGGELIPKNQYGSKVVYNWDTPHQAIKPKADAEGVSVEMQEARDQYIDKDNKSVDNPNAGLTAAQMTRIGYAVLDLTSAVAAFFPGYGTAISAGTGLTSTFGNLITDLADDAVTGGQAWKNFGMNLGMDALGLIPGGGAASKMGKIVKTLKSVVPVMIALPGVASMLANSPEIAASWKKAFDGDPENGGSKMDYQDYMNILQVLNVVTAGSNIAVNKYKSAKRSTKQADKLAVDVFDATSKQRRALVLEGDDIKKFKEANAKGEAQKFVDELEGPGKYTINEITEANKGKFWGKDDNGKFELFHQNPLGRSNTGKANTLELKWDNKLNKMYAETGKWEADLGLEDGDLVDVSAGRRFDAEVGRLQGDLDAVTGKMKQSMTARAKRTRQVTSELTPEKARLTELQTKLHGVPDAATLQTNKTQLEADLATVESQITARQQAVATAEADLQRLLGKKRVAKKNRAAHNAAIRAARGRVQGHKATLQGYESTKQRHLAGIATIDQQLQMHSELPVAQAKVSRLEGILNQLNPSTHTHAYNKLQQMVADYQTNHSTIEGRTVNWDMAEILNNAGIRNAFKQGGSINRNKINKFLNYAKG